MKKGNRLPDNQIIIYQTENGGTRVDVYIQDESAWLTQDQIAVLFGKGRSTVAEHIGNIFKEGELDEQVVCREIRRTTRHGAIKGKKQEKSAKLYNLDVIIAVGYRVKSERGMQFRKWATGRLREYIVKGFTIDDERLAEGGVRARYFRELLERVRSIRASERNFYQQVTDIYATSIDYKKDDVLTQEFFATVQNKMHYAVHGHTAAEIIALRADNKKPVMGLTSFKGSYITESDTKIAKNYLSEKELKQLQLIVSLYLDFAELQASNEVPMTMRDWIEKLDDFLKAGGKQLLKTAGTVSSQQAADKAKSEYAVYRAKKNAKYVSDFDREMKRLEQDIKKTKYKKRK